jgi:hypothetical protein
MYRAREDGLLKVIPSPQQMLEGKEYTLVLLSSIWYMDVRSTRTTLLHSNGRCR